MTRIEGNIVDVVNRKIYPGVINVEGSHSIYRRK